MTARCALVGSIAPSSQPAAMRVRGVPVEPTRTPIVALELCPCGREDCDCDEWPEIMHTAPFEDAAENKPLFTWADENLGGTWTATGRLHWNWRQSEEDWICTGC